MTAPSAQYRWMRKRSQLDRLSRHLPPDHPELLALRSDLGVNDLMQARIAKLLAEMPALTDEQRTRLAELLKPVRIIPGGVR